MMEMMKFHKDKIYSYHLTIIYNKGWCYGQIFNQTSILRMDQMFHLSQKWP